MFRKRLPEGRLAFCIGIPYTKEQFLTCCERGNSDFVDSLELEYKTTDALLLWEYYRPLASELQKSVEALKKMNVAVMPVETASDFRQAFGYDAVILLAHRHRREEALEFLGSLVPLREVVDCIPEDYHGTLDISSCHSALFLMKCKQRAPYATVVVAASEMSVALKLFIIVHTVKYWVSRPKIGYVDALRVVLARIERFTSERQKKKKRVFLGGETPDGAPSEDPGMVSAFSPDEIVAGDTLMVQVYIYGESGHDKITAEARKADSDAEERDSAPLNFNLQAGDKVDVELYVAGHPELYHRKSVVWRGDRAKISFLVNTPATLRERKLFISCMLKVNEAPLGELNFSVRVVSEYSGNKGLSEVISKPFRQVFISYSHLDEENVKYIAQAYRALGIKYFFDRHYLKPGDIFPIEIQKFIETADLFILCWSKNSCESEYVARELAEALKRAYPSVDYEDANRIVIHPLSIEPRTSLPEKMRDYYHFAEL